MHDNLESIITSLKLEKEFSWKYCVYRFKNSFLAGVNPTYQIEVIIDNAWTPYMNLTQTVYSLIFPGNVNKLSDVMFYECSAPFLYPDLLAYLEAKSRNLFINSILNDL